MLTRCIPLWLLPLLLSGGSTLGASLEVNPNLQDELQALLQAPALRRAEVGLSVVRLDDDRELFAHQADRLLIPASNIKVLTTAAALHFLTPDYRFETEIYGELQPDGTVKGDLVAKGHGDPSLVPERVWYLANRLFYLGVRRVEGDIVADDSFFDGPRHAAGQKQDSSSYSYMAPAGALSVGFNSIQVHILPATEPGKAATVLLDPASRYAQVRGSVRTSRRSRTYARVVVSPSEDRSVIQVSGRILVNDPGRSYWRRVDNPPIFAAEVLRAALTQVGIVVEGEVRHDLVPDGATLLLTLPSERLAALIGWINKNSNNFMASQLARTLGAERFGTPGTWTKGKAAIEAFLRQEVGIPTDDYELGNASGLHDVNRVTPRQMVQLLRYMYRQPKLRPEFLASLAVAGGAGTLQDRMHDTDAEQLLRGKTGTLSSASALSGYVTTRAGETLAFSVLINGYTTSITEIWTLQDRLGALLAAHGPQQGNAARPANLGSGALGTHSERAAGGAALSSKPTSTGVLRR